MGIFTKLGQVYFWLTFRNHLSWGHKTLWGIQLGRRIIMSGTSIPEVIYRNFFFLRAHGFFYHIIVRVPIHLSHWHETKAGRWQLNAAYKEGLKNVSKRKVESNSQKWVRSNKRNRPFTVNLPPINWCQCHGFFHETIPLISLVKRFFPLPHKTSHSSWIFYAVLASVKKDYGYR